jgi:hypothetical protein
LLPPLLQPITSRERLTTLVIRDHLLLQSMTCLTTGPGTTSMEPTTWPISATSISHSTAALAGPTLRLQVFLTALRLRVTLPGPTLTSPLRFLFLAKIQVWAAMEVILSSLTDGCMRTRLPMKLAQYTKLEDTQTASSAQQWSYVETAAQVMHALFHLSIESTRLTSMG